MARELYKLRDKIKEIESLINDLYFDYDRMSTSGQDTLDEINKILLEVKNEQK